MKLLLATEEGRLQIYDIDNDTIQTIFVNDTGEGNMGTIITDKHIFVACNSKIYKLSKANYSIVKTSNRFMGHSFHQINMYDNKIYLTVTQYNQIWVFDVNLNLLQKNNIKTPIQNTPVKYKFNYNHINNIIKKDNKFYVDLNWLTSEQYGMSGVAVLDEDFNEIERFEFGWESHEFQFIEDSMICICATSGTHKKINHPHKGGIMIDGELVFEHDPDEAFCKGLTWDDNYFYLCGGEKKKLGDRENGRGIIYKIHREDYSLFEKITHNNIKNIKSVLIWEK